MSAHVCPPIISRYSWAPGTRSRCVAAQPRARRSNKHCFCSQAYRLVRLGRAGSSRLHAQRSAAHGWQVGAGWHSFWLSHVAWALSQHSGWVSKPNVPRERARQECITSVTKLLSHLASATSATLRQWRRSQRPPPAPVSKAREPNGKVLEECVGWAIPLWPFGKIESILAT